jgi:hypothetical protein
MSSLSVFSGATDFVACRGTEGADVEELCGEDELFVPDCILMVMFELDAGCVKGRIFIRGAVGPLVLDTLEEVLIGVVGDRGREFVLVVIFVVDIVELEEEELNEGGITGGVVVVVNTEFVLGLGEIGVEEREAPVDCVFTCGSCVWVGAEGVTI